MAFAQETKEVAELAAGYTKQIVEALTPIAKQAYEIGLITLRIDAAQSIFIGLVALALLIAYFWNFRRACRIAETNSNDHGFVAMAFLIAGGLLSIVAFVVAFNTILQVWTWVKLFSPQLWLAHQAVEKLLK